MPLHLLSPNRASEWPETGPCRPGTAPPVLTLLACPPGLVPTPWETLTPTPPWDRDADPSLEQRL